MDIGKYIMKKSKELDIDIIGFTSCEPLHGLKGYLMERKNIGRETEFEERDMEKRMNPRATLPGCKSIVVVGISYNSEFKPRPSRKPWGKLSRSSWGLDYHEVLWDRMERLIGAIQEKRGFNYKCFVDTGPLVDRELARNAGIGYYGKNCSIINPKYGSFIFIGYILTDLDIEVKPTVLEEECGICTQCIKACPTGALESPYGFNPMKCISYLTQTKERIPYELRKHMGNSIYGCDICQNVCPKNRNIAMGNYKEFIPRDDKGYIDIEGILSISNKDFNAKFGSMAGAWRGRNIWRRNAIIALGNTGDRAYLPMLKPFLKDPSPMLREYAIWAILNIDYGYGMGWIRDILEDEENEDIKSEAERIIAYFDTRNIQE